MARPLQRLTFADYTPDAPSYLSGSVPAARNVVPRVDGTDGPLRGPVPYSDPLPGPCRGAIAARDSSGATYMIAATASQIYQLTGRAWSPIGRAGGYTTPTEGDWHFAQFGDRIVGTNGEDEPQSWVLGSPAFADLAGAPVARFVAAIEPGFVMLGQYDAGDGVVTGGLSWSGYNDATLWPVPGTQAATSVQRDVQELPNGGAVQAIIPAVAGANAVILSERAIHRVEYVGPPSIFAFREVDRSRGCICPNGVAQVGSTVYFIGEDGFLAYDGSSIAPIGQGKVDATFLSQVDRGQLHRVYASVDPDRRLVVWAYPTAGASAPRNWLVYSYATGKWRPGDDPSLAVELLVAARTAAATLDDLEMSGMDLDAPGAPSFDAPVYSGGQRVFAGFDTAHRLVSFDGSTLPARIETQDTDSQDGRRIFVSGIRLLTDAPTYSAGVGMRESLADSVMYSPATAPGRDGMCPQRVSTRYGRAFAQIPAGVPWTYLQGAEAVLRSDGRY
jgi:hypothetical protein